MKKEENFEDFHIGRMIKEIVDQQKIAPSKISGVLYPVRYQVNKDKIFKIKDMDIEDVIRISQVLAHKLLTTISCKYLSHIQLTGKFMAQAYDIITLNLETRRYTIGRKEEIFDFIKNFHIGDYIKEIAKEKELNTKELAAAMKRDQSHVSYYFKRNSMKIKPLILFSNALKHNLIAEIYLIRLSIPRFIDCTIKLNSHQNDPEKQDEGDFSIFFSPPNRQK